TILPDGRVTTDGRLREHLDAIPADEWLDKFNVRYIITGTVGDVWVEDVFFDRQITASLEPNERLSIAWLPDFEADEIHLLTEQMVSHAKVTLSADETLEIPFVELTDTPGLWIAKNEQPISLLGGVAIVVTDEPADVTAISVVNSQEGWFQSVVPGSYKMVHSGDVKIYENLDVWERAFLVESGTRSLDSAAKVEDSSPIFDVYEPGFIKMSVFTVEPRLLVLTDTNYPGWSATVNGEAAEIIELDGLLMGVELPVGEHDVVFEYRPQTFQIGFIITLITLGLAICLYIWAFLTKSSAKN
ncbi:MAG: YfhO family protein, partial [Chloroflexota bacterium]